MEWIKILELWRWFYLEKCKNVEKIFVYWFVIWDFFFIIVWKRKRNGLYVKCLYLNWKLIKNVWFLICRKILSNRVGYFVSFIENERYNIVCVWLERRLFFVVVVSKYWKSYFFLYSICVVVSGLVLLLIKCIVCFV